MGNVGLPELLLIFLAVLLLFGAKRIPEIARGLGKGIREFKDATSDIKKELTVGDQPTSHQVGQGGYAQPYGPPDQRGYVPPPGTPYAPPAQPTAPHTPPAPGEQPPAPAPASPVADVPGMPPASPSTEGQTPQS